MPTEPGENPENPENTPAQADDALRWQLYNDQKKQAWEDIQSSTDSYDQSLLTLSSGALGLSIAFIKDIVPLQDATWLPLLYASWLTFGLCILTTVVSFQVAIKAQNENLRVSYKYYIERDDSYGQEQGKHSKRLSWCTMLAGILFVLALTCTIIFAIENVGRYSKMPDVRRLQEGRAPVSMTPVPGPGETRGRPPAEITPIPGQAPIAPTTPVQPPSAPPAKTQTPKDK